MKYDYVILDPASTEFNRGSFCYLPYILYSSLKSKGYSVFFWENFTTADIDNIPESKKGILISLWSYPQIDACKILNRFCNPQPMFFGYYPLIEHLELPVWKIPDEFILTGLSSYPYYYSDFKYLLLSDCDMHLAKYEGIVYPLFTSYGCPNGCSFCPSTINCDKNRLILDESLVIKHLGFCRSKNIKNIHFTDEDFFFNPERTFNILSSQKYKGMNFIAMGSVLKVQKFIKLYGEDILVDSGVKLIEIGFETGDSDLSSSMKKPKLSVYEKLAESVKKVDLFWLTLTFFPGETIKTLNKTGEFLKIHGKKPEDLYSRIATNSTVGGLGQFMQVYHGIKNYKKLINQGEELTKRPVRLLPSFIPYSFMNSQVKKINYHLFEGNGFWFSLYGINQEKYKNRLLENRTLIHSGGFPKSSNEKTEWYIFCAICARLGIIE